MTLKFKTGAFALVLFTLLSCSKSPTDGLQLVVDNNIIKYTALVNIVDGTGEFAVPPGLTMTITGQDVDDIYELAGKKVFNVSSGIITIGSGPALTPTAANPIKFNINITAPGYTTVVQAIQFTPGQEQQIVTVTMVAIGADYVAPTITGPDPAPLTPATPSITITPISLDFSGTCANKANFILKPNMYAFYREKGSGQPFQYLGYLSKGKLTTTLLTLGKTYEFEITYGGVAYTVTQLVNQTSYNITIDLGTVCSNF